MENNEIYKQLGILQGKYEAVHNQQNQLKADIDKRLDELKSDMNSSHSRLESNIKDQYRKLEEDFKKHHESAEKANAARDEKLDEVLQELRSANLSEMKRSVQEHQEAKHKFSGALKLWGMITGFLGLIAGLFSTNFFK